MKIDFRDLVAAGQLKEETDAESDQIERLLERSALDLLSANKLLPSDEAGAMDFVYKALFHAANALIRFHGFRPGLVRQHQGVITAVSRILGKEFEELTLKFDRLRRRRIVFEYQAVFEMGEAELKDMMVQARTFLSVTKKKVQKR